MDLQTLLSRGLVRPTDFYDCGMKLGAVVMAQLIYQSLTTLKIRDSILPKSSIEKEKRKEKKPGMCHHWKSWYNQQQVLSNFQMIQTQTQSLLI